MGNRAGKHRFTAVAAAALLAASGTSQAGTHVAIVHGDVLCRTTNRTLTRDGKNSQAVLSPDGHTVAFIHQVKPSPEADFPEEATNDLWLGDCATGRIHRLAAPASDTDMFASMGNPVFSLDGRLIYVSLFPGGDYLVVHQVDVTTGRHSFVLDAQLEGVIRTGPYRGDLLATQHTDLTDRDGQHYGGYPYYIFRPDGTTVMRIPGSENWRGQQLKRWLTTRHWQVW